MAAGVPSNNQHQLVTAHLSEQRMLPSERAQIGVARFGELDDLGTGGIEVRQSLREAGEAAGWLHGLWCLPPLAAIEDHREDARLTLLIDRGVEPPGALEAAEKAALNRGHMLHAFQHRPSSFGRHGAGRSFLDTFNRRMQVLAALLERFHNFNFLFRCH